MLAAHLVCDTPFAMYRRGLMRRVILMATDALHVNSRVFRRIAMPIVCPMKEGIRKPSHFTCRVVAAQRSASPRDSLPRRHAVDMARNCRLHCVLPSSVL